MSRFFEERKVAGWQKHEILTRYLTPWSRKLGSRYPTLAFVDLCAGAGEYGDGEALGSPLIAARVNERLPESRRLIVHACEHTAEVDTLRRALRVELGHVPPLAYVYDRPFQEVLPEILELTAQTPTLVFLDPCGVHGIEEDSIRPILDATRRAPTEFLVRVPPNSMARMAGWLRSREERPAGGRKTADGCRNLLERVNVPESILRHIEDIDPDQPLGISDTLLRHYLRLLEERYQFVNVIPIRERYDGKPRYYLVHCTDHKDGLLIMNDVASCVDDSLFEVTLGMRAQGDLFGATVMEPRTDVRAATDWLAHFLIAGTSFTFDDLRIELVLRFGPDLRSKQHRQVVDLLVERGQLMKSPVDASRDRARFRTAPRSAPPGIRPKSGRRAPFHKPSGSDRRPA